MNRFNAYENKFILISIKKRIYDYKNKWKEKKEFVKNNGKDERKNRVVIGWIPEHMGIRG